MYVNVCQGKKKHQFCDNTSRFHVIRDIFKNCDVDFPPVVHFPQLSSHPGLPHTHQSFASAAHYLPVVHLNGGDTQVVGVQGHHGGAGSQVEHPHSASQCGEKRERCDFDLLIRFFAIMLHTGVYIFVLLSLIYVEELLFNEHLSVLHNFTTSTFKPTYLTNPTFYVLDTNKYNNEI